MTYTEPLLSLLAVGFAAWLWTYRRSPGHGMAAAGLVFLMLISWPPFDWLLARPLEAWYPSVPFNAEPTDAIVILAGGISPARPGFPFESPNEATVDRCEFGIWLFKHWGHVPVLVSGGPERPGGKPYAVTLREFLEQAGVDPALIWTEERSGSTHENALYGAEILRRHGVRSIALVTGRQSMLRAEECFRKEGFQVTPAPSDERDLKNWHGEVLPSWSSIRRNEITLHETIGLLWYHLHAWV
jgi:uncharacterized SAM-binding protein YcdF (DUF218 family)